MKILHCIPTLEGGGAERQLCYLAQGLVSSGIDVRVACMRGGVNAVRLRAANVEPEEWADISPASPRTLWRLWRTIRRERPDIVQTWICQMDVWGGMAARLTRTPWIVSERCSRQAYPPTLKNRARLRIASNPSLVIANSEAGAQYWREEFGSAPRPVEVIRNALPLAEIDASPAGRIESLEAPGRFVLFAGRLDAQKNLKVLLRALASLVREEDVRVLLCGEGPEESELRRLTTELRIADRVIFAGYLRNLYSLMKSAAVFVSISRFEGHPNTVMEAMACGCPLVVSNIPAHLEFLDEGNAYIAPVEDVQAIASQLRACLRDSAGASARAARARVVAEKWGIAASTERYIAAYRAVAPGAA